jgi:hypothetical protein
MRTTTYNPSFDTAAAPARPGLFSRFCAALIKGQELRARRIVHAHLAHQDDATLTRLGWSKADIDALRRAPAVAVLPL